MKTRFLMISKTKGLLALLLLASFALGYFSFQIEFDPSNLICGKREILLSSLPYFDELGFVNSAYDREIHKVIYFNVWEVDALVHTVYECRQEDRVVIYAIAEDSASMRQKLDYYQASLISSYGGSPND